MESEEPTPHVERRKRKKSDYAWIATIITALGTSVGSIIAQSRGHTESDKVAKSTYVATTTELALIEYRLTQIEESMKRREERVNVGGMGRGVGGGIAAPMPIIPMPASAPAAPLPSFEELQQHVKKTGEAFKEVLAK